MILSFVKRLLNSRVHEGSHTRYNTHAGPCTLRGNMSPSPPRRQTFRSTLDCPLLVRELLQNPGRSASDSSDPFGSKLVVCSRVEWHS